MRLSFDEKRLAEALQGRVIVEASEMAGLGRSDVESLKAFLTDTQDDVRLAYRENPELIPRYAAIVGTANPNINLPNDEALLRRFVPVHLDFHPELESRTAENAYTRVASYFRKHRDQLWAEALAGFKNDFSEANSPRLPDDLKDVAKDAADNISGFDPLIQGGLSRIQPKFALMGMPMDVLLCAIGAVDDPSKITRAMQMRTAKALIAEGWAKKRAVFEQDGVRKKQIIWFKMENTK
jgi:hypothetical protein